MSKNVYIFAGVNGAGKSTLYNARIDDEDVLKSVRINTDEIVRSFGDWRKGADQIKAGKIAIQQRNECLRFGKSFNEETTLTGKTILKTIEKAKELGYTIHLYYVGVDSPEIAKQRVKNRVSQGGHDIPAEVIEKRYYESLQNLEKIIAACDFVGIYDNTNTYQEIFYSVKNEVIKNNIENSNWAGNAIAQKMKSIQEHQVEKTNPLLEKIKEKREEENKQHRGLKR